MLRRLTLKVRLLAPGIITTASAPRPSLSFHPGDRPNSRVFKLDADLLGHFDLAHRRGPPGLEPVEPLLVRALPPPGHVQPLRPAPRARRAIPPEMLESARGLQVVL